MNIVLPIVFFAVLLGLFSRRITPAHWGALLLWISLVTAYYYVKH